MKGTHASAACLVVLASACGARPATAVVVGSPVFEASYAVVRCAKGRCGDADAALGVPGSPRQIVDVGDVRFAMVLALDLEAFPDVPDELRDRDLSSLCDHVPDDCTATLWRLGPAAREAVAVLPPGSHRDLLGATSSGAYVRTDDALLILPMAGEVRSVPRPEAAAPAWLDSVTVASVTDGTLVVSVVNLDHSTIYAIDPDARLPRTLPIGRVRATLAVEGSPWLLRMAADGCEVWDVVHATSRAAPCVDLTHAWSAGSGRVLALERIAREGTFAVRIVEVSSGEELPLGIVARAEDLEVRDGAVRFVTDVRPAYGARWTECRFPDCDCLAAGLAYADLFGTRATLHEWRDGVLGGPECGATAPGGRILSPADAHAPCGRIETIETWLASREAPALSACPGAEESFHYCMAALSRDDARALERCVTDPAHVDLRSLVWHRMEIIQALESTGELSPPVFVGATGSEVVFQLPGLAGEARIPLAADGCGVRVQLDA